MYIIVDIVVCFSLLDNANIHFFNEFSFYIIHYWIVYLKKSYIQNPGDICHVYRSDINAIWYETRNQRMVLNDDDIFICIF